jgi:hypothetical protein
MGLDYLGLRARQADDRQRGLVALSIAVAAITVPPNATAMGGARRGLYSNRFSACRGGPVPKHPLFRPISIAVANWSRVADGFDITAETASHFVDALSRSPVHPVSTKANSRAMILIWVPSARASVAPQASHGPTVVVPRQSEAATYFQYTVSQPLR